MTSMPAPCQSGAVPDRDALTDLLVRVASLEDQIDALNRTVFRQQQYIDKITQALIGLQGQIRSGGGGASLDPRDDIPPHY
jgi:SlyX protein